MDDMNDEERLIAGNDVSVSLECLMGSGSCGRVYKVKESSPVTNHVDAECWDWRGNIDLAVLNRLVQVPRADER
jgi:hypothetical protein